MDWNKKYLLLFSLKSIAGIVLGAVGGFLYYYYVGCQSGTCAIKSNPFMMTAWGAVMGYLLGDMFNKKTKEKAETSE